MNDLRKNIIKSMKLEEYDKCIRFLKEFFSNKYTFDVVVGTFIIKLALDKHYVAVCEDHKYMHEVKPINDIIAILFNNIRYFAEIYNTHKSATVFGRINSPENIPDNSLNNILDNLRI